MGNNILLERQRESDAYQHKEKIQLKLQRHPALSYKNMSCFLLNSRKSNPVAGTLEDTLAWNNFWQRKSRSVRNTFADYFIGQNAEKDDKKYNQFNF